MRFAASLVASTALALLASTTIAFPSQATRLEARRINHVAVLETRMYNLSEKMKGLSVSSSKSSVDKKVSPSGSTLDKMQQLSPSSSRPSSDQEMQKLSLASSNQQKHESSSKVTTTAHSQAKPSGSFNFRAPGSGQAWEIGESMPAWKPGDTGPSADVGRFFARTGSKSAKPKTSRFNPYNNPKPLTRPKTKAKSRTAIQGFPPPGSQY